MKVHLFFEQSGTWKRAFANYGITAYDYDIENQFNQTDFQYDLFAEIENEYQNMQTLERPNPASRVFNGISSKDLIIAFYPCTYFCENNMLYFTGQNFNYRDMTKTDVLNDIISRADKQHYFYKTLLKFCYIVEKSGYKCIIENPNSPLHFLTNHFPYKCYVDRNRNLRGDIFNKPTRYYFINCKPHNLISYCVTSKQVKKIKYMNHGIERSLMTLEYVSTFIADVILGISTKKIQQKELIF